MKYLAHISEDGLREQTVEEHCAQTADLSKKYAKGLETEYIAYIAALLHDIGKFVPKFDDYVRGNKSYHRGEIDHSYAGAKYIIEFCREMGSDYYEVAHFIARIIVSHHC